MGMGSPKSVRTNLKENELVRKKVFEWLGESGQSIVLCAHASNPGNFTKDPVFPDGMKRAGYAAKLESIGVAPPDRGGVSMKETRGGRAVKLDYGGNAVSIERDMYDRIRRIHKKHAKKSADFLDDAWRASFRYKSLGMFGGMSASVPPEIYRKLRIIEPRAMECFASFFNHVLDGGYRGLFPDVESNFGCRGNFFHLTKPLPMMLCNPPFDRCVMNAFVDHLLRLLDSGAGSAVVILPVFDVDDRKRLNDSDKCKSKYPVDYITDVNTEKLKRSAHAKWYGMFCKERFPYVEMSSGKTIAYTSTMILYMSSYKNQKQEQELVEKIAGVFPKPDVPTNTIPLEKARLRKKWPNQDLGGRSGTQ